MQVFVDLMSLL